MNARERTAVNYLTPPVYSFWSVSDGGETFAWRDGKTIAFRTELEVVFRRLEKQPLPPLGAILLLLAAARDSWEHGVSEMGILSGLLDQLSGSEARPLPIRPPVKKTWSADLLVEVFCTLDDVHKLPAELRHSAQAKAEIVALVCDDTEQSDRTTSAADVLAVLTKGLHDAIEVTARGQLANLLGPIEIETTSAAKESLRALRSSLSCLCEKSSRIRDERLRLRLKTGLDELPLPAPLELTPVEQTLALINSLQNDNEFRGLARLTRNVVAAVHLPKPIAEFDKMPLGGVSDIVNRGALDRLLLSELAHDDLTLAVRVATNEALYLRRESPPSNPPRDRIVLLDAGLRTWGVLRVFGTAIGLALAATSDRQIAPRVYRSTDDDVATIDFTTREGLVAHLGALASTLHPAAALTALVDEIDSPALTDTVLVTTVDTLADPRFARALAELALPPLHVATVDRDGSFRLLLVSRQGRKTLREARFALDELLSPTQSAPLIDRELQHGRPAILFIEPFPLLLAHPLELERAWLVADHGALSITRDGRLLQWTSPTKGGKQLTAEMARGTLHWAATDIKGDGILRAVVGRLSKQGLRLWLIDLENEACVSHPLSLHGETPRSVTEYQGVIYVVFDDHVEAFDSTSAEPWGQLPLRDLQWVRGRFFRKRQHPWHEFYALGFDGISPQFEPLPGIPFGGEVLTVFDCPGADGPLAVTIKGIVRPYHDRGKPCAVFDTPGWGIDAIAISRDGARVALQQKQLPAVGVAKGMIVDVAEGRRIPFVGNPHEAVEPDLRRLVQPRPVRHRFHSIAPLRDGTLALSTGKRGWWRLTCNEAAQIICLQHVQLQPLDDMIRHFGDPPSAEVGYTLRAAAWSDGSTAFLDSRGLLHLRSSFMALPEATIVLSEGRMAGWLADGRCWGDDYFLPDGTSRLRPSGFFEQVLKPFVSHLTC